MKLLADENFPPTLISVLQKKKHDVKRVQRSDKGISDTGVRNIAKIENRIIITFDQDLLTTKPHEEKVSVMLFYFPQMMPEEILLYLDDAIEKIRELKKKKKPFTAIYSEQGLQLLEPTKSL